MKRRKLRRKKNKKKNTFLLLVLLSIIIILYFKIFKTEKRRIAIEGFGMLEENLSSKAVGVYNLNSGEIIFEKSPDLKVAPASLAKLFVIDYALTILDMDEIVYIGEEIYLVQEDSSLAYIQPGEMKVEDIIKAMLIPSGNDAANALAAASGRRIAGEETLNPQDAIDLFIDRLGEYLLQEGYQNTNITVPSGYNDENYTNIIDLKKVSFKLLENPVISNIVSSPYYIYTDDNGNTLKWENTNEMLNTSSRYYNPDITGVKTGSLDNNYNLISRYSRDEDYLIIVIGAGHASTRYYETDEIISILEANR
ncbi:MAG: serine hydrolase [Tissierellia bacterium]|nr:serine hydrolase [Tissierellia bacterium]